MMKRILACLLALLLVFPSAAAEQEQPKFIEAREGEFAALQIRSLESDAAVGVLGVESAPTERRWEDFARVFTAFLKTNWDEDAAFFGVVWSDGEWLRVYDAGGVVVRVYTADDTEDGLIRRIVLTGVDAESAGAVQVLSAAAFWAAAQYGEYGKYAMQIVFTEDHTGDWFGPEPVDVWLENGYQLTYGLKDAEIPWGLIRFTEELETTGGFAPMNPEGMDAIPPGLTPDAFFQALREQIQAVPPSDFLSAPAPAAPDAWLNIPGGRMAVIPWDDCSLILYADGEGRFVTGAALACLSGDTFSACLHLFPLYGALTRSAEDVIALLPCILGGHGTWEDMCALTPYCVLDGVMLQCEIREINGEPLPVAHIGGAGN